MEGSTSGEIIPHNLITIFRISIKRAHQVFTDSLEMNINLLLFKLHLGALRCTETELHELIRDGVQSSQSLRYLYIVTHYTELPVISQINMSSSMLVISAVKEEQ